MLSKEELGLDDLGTSQPIQIAKKCCLYGCWATAKKVCSG